MRAKMSMPEPPVPSASTRVISDAPSGKQALIRAGKTLRMVLERGTSRVTLTSLAAMRSRWRTPGASGGAGTNSRAPLSRRG